MMQIVIDIDEKDYEFIKSVNSIMKNSDTFQLESNGYGKRITKIGHITNNKWFDIDEFFSKSKEKSNGLDS